MADLGWQPRIGLETGLARTVEYFDGLLAGTEKAEVV
jgi:UDP-glucuronate decarboxylase